MRSQGLIRLSGPIATSEIVLSYALSTLAKRTDFNFSGFLVFLKDILFTVLKRCHSDYAKLRRIGCDW